MGAYKNDSGTLRRYALNPRPWELPVGVWGFRGGGRGVQLLHEGGRQGLEALGA